MLQITSETIQGATSPLQPSTFPGLVQRHPQGIEQALSLETSARRLLAAGFTDQQLGAFIRDVCAWGNYPRTAERVLEGSPFPEIRRRFDNAIAALTFVEPDLKLALREVRRIRYLGLSFASKHLRLLRPDLCPVLDSILSERLGYPLNVAGYQRFADHCSKIARWLDQRHVPNPVPRQDGSWFVADVEMALYVHVKEQLVSQKG